MRSHRKQYKHPPHHNLIPRDLSEWARAIVRSMLANALSVALCHVNRFAPAKDGGSCKALRPRVPTPGNVTISTTLPLVLGLFYEAICSPE